MNTRRGNAPPVKSIIDAQRPKRTRFGLVYSYQIRTDHRTKGNMICALGLQDFHMRHILPAYHHRHQYTARCRSSDESIEAYDQILLNTIRISYTLFSKQEVRGDSRKRLFSHA
jgi:hypothetical protein